MSPASPSLPSSDSRLKWRKRKRDPSNLKRQDEDDDEDDDDEPEDDDDNNHHNQDSPANNLNGDPILDVRESEVLSDLGQRISDFPVAIKRSVNRPHPSVIALVAAERFSTVRALPMLENISHGQLQALSSVPRDNLVLNLAAEQDKASAYVCTPPVLMEGRGVEKRFVDGSIHIVPMHSDWFSPTTVHRLERQVVPHYFSGKSSDHTPEKYMALRNKIVSKYLENPGKRLAFGDCQGLVSSSELYDLSRIVRFLDNWGIINYVSASSRGFRMAGSLMSGSLIKEDVNGELNVHTSHLRSIDSLILFDKPKCSLRLEDISALCATADGAKHSDGGLLDLDTRIRERFSEHACSYCSRPLPHLHYQSQKEADTILCSECFHDAKHIVGHSSIDFVRVDSRKETFDPDGDNWTDQETLLLLEALEKYKDNWNEIAEYVGTKSKAQCILHFLRLPMEDGLLESIEVMPTNGQSDPKGHAHVFSDPNANGDMAGVCTQEANSGNEIPFANAANPVMSLVAFLTSAIGPRVAAACASASLAVLTSDNPRSSTDKMNGEASPHGPNANFGHQKNMGDQNPHAKIATSALSPDRVKLACMSGLSAAAMKAKLFADQEEREVQRLAATIINHQLKRLELKLKQFAEVETLLMKECEQVEKTRQRLSTERVRMMSTRFTAPGTTLPTAAGPSAAGAAMAMNTTNTSTRAPTMPTSAGQPNISPAAFGNSIPQNSHPHMQFMQRQQMYGFGPRLPLSAINPSSSGPSQS
ncbi:SWI/SNF complex subunit SWI3C isoform X2 [Asparagus officinalis]|nr:SWI/SNF complex subunit SWI3C isoform X2 [Asparagus officinalis]